MKYINGKAEANSIYNYIGKDQIKASTGIENIDGFAHLYPDCLELLKSDGYAVKHIIKIIKKKEALGAE